MVFGSNNTEWNSLITVAVFGEDRIIWLGDYKFKAAVCLVKIIVNKFTDLKYISRTETVLVPVLTICNVGVC